MTAQPNDNSPPPLFGPGNPDYERWRSEVQFFLDNRKKLWDQPDLRSKFIATRNHEIVDKDEDEFVLAERVGSRFPHDVVVISKVELTDRVIQLPDMEYR